VNIKFKHLHRGQTAELHKYLNRVAVTSQCFRVLATETHVIVCIFIPSRLQFQFRWLQFPFNIAFVMSMKNTRVVP